MAERLPGMVKYSRHFLPEVFRVFQSTVRTAVFWVGTVLATVALALNRHWAGWFDLKAFPRWVALLLLGAALLFALLRASYRRYEAKEQEIGEVRRTLEGVREELRRQQAPDSLLGLRAEGWNLRRQLIASDQMESWSDKQDRWFWSVVRSLQDHFTESDVQKFREPWLAVAPDEPGAVNETHATYRRTLEARLRLLDEIIAKYKGA
jgi:hypothetical protein